MMENRILTEEELNEQSRLIEIMWTTGGISKHEEIGLQKVINSHRELFKANAGLSYENMKLKDALTDISTHVGDISKKDFFNHSYHEVRKLAYKALEELK